ncbi:MAG TPA: carboxypeptidase-like regulatory domain-containing protein [Nostocaceae cyanobacterium]|nr:carboxypeptidase-like regulatory domain-containing protein [Nostocaceae cyanobacterium]
MGKRFWKNYIYLLTAITIFSFIVPVQADNTNIANSPTNQLKQTEEFTVFPVGLNVNKRNVNPGVLIRGKEDGSQAVDFNNWLVPYDAVIQALKINITTLPDGQLEARSPGLITRIDPKKLRNDPELGLVFSVEELTSFFGITAEFDINEYAIVLIVPWANQNSSNLAETTAPIQLTGLPQISPNNFGITAIEQKVTASGNENIATNYRGELVTVGSAFGGSWFIRTNQPNLENQESWNITEAQFLRQTNQYDYFLGSQPTFWQNQGIGDYWGLTYIQRQGFTPPQLFSGGFVDPRQRLQSSAVGRTIAGTAEPGTLVRLVQGFGERVIAEILVDSSGVYRFENVKSENQFFASSYRVLLYPQGRLTAQPEIREATFSTVPGQLPAGASAVIVSGGLRREFAVNSLFGNFGELRGGIAGRWGLSESLTVGLGGIYDKSPQGLAELFYRPNSVPLQIAISALFGNESNINTDIRYDPTTNLSASFINDRFSSRFNANWRVVRNLNLFTQIDSRDATSGGLLINFSGRDAYTFARLSYDSKNRLRWNLLQRLGKLELTQRGNEIGTFSELSYRLSKNSFLDSGHALILNYETNNQTRNNNLLNFGWRYRSPQRAIDGNFVWEIQIGYGVGSQGNGIVASLGTTILPGLLLRGRYQGVALTSDQSSFSIDLVSSLGLQQGIKPGDRRAEYFRTQGGLLIQPFFDDNNNGKLDPGEKIYTNNPELLIIINNRPLKSFQPDIRSDRILLRLFPGIYRLDLDPSGFPPDWQAKQDGLAVDVVAGGYTAVSIPFIRAFTRAGVVTDIQGNAVAGARVEAIDKNQNIRRFSVTNAAGVFYLENLPQGNYTIEINGLQTGSLKLEPTSEPFQELNLQQPAN